MNDLISRQAAIEAVNELTKWYWETYHEKRPTTVGVIDKLMELPSVQPEWNNHTVACLLAELFDDTCACNYNGIDEWLPGKCELLNSCPNPVGVACWEQYLNHRAERRTDEGSD